MAGCVYTSKLFRWGECGRGLGAERPPEGSSGVSEGWGGIAEGRRAGTAAIGVGAGAHTGLHRFGEQM